MDVAVTHVDPGAAECSRRLRVPPQRRVADLVDGGRHGPDLDPAHCGPPPLRHRDRLDPPALSTNLNNHPETIRLSPSLAAATWKHDPCPYISTVTQATSGEGYLEDHRHVDTRSDLDRA